MEDFLSIVEKLHNKGEWREILKILQKEEKWYCYVLWVRPSEDNLHFIGNCVMSVGLKGVVSIGCGSGLLESLIYSATGLDVFGVEVDRKFWKLHCKNHVPQFVKHIYPDDPDFDMYCRTDKYALLFCYFNYRKPFDNYIRNYNGRCVIIIGPGYGRGTHTDPEPFNPKFCCDRWTLSSSQEIGSTKDFIAVYTRETCNQD